MKKLIFITTILVLLTKLSHASGITFSGPNMTISFSSATVPSPVTIALDTQTFWANPNNGTNAKPTWNITVGNGNSNPYKVLFVQCQYQYSTAGTQISSVTLFNVSTFTFTLSTRAVDTGNEVASELWYYINPPSGSTSLQMNTSNVLHDNLQVCGAISLSGVSQSTVIEATAVVINSGSPASGNVVMTTSGDWLLDSWQATAVTSVTGTAGQTIANIGFPTTVASGYSYEGPLTPQTFADSYTFASGGMTYVIAAVKPGP